MGVASSPRSASTTRLRAMEIKLFGVTMGGECVTVHDWFLTHHWDALDLWCAVPYGTFIFASLGCAVVLYGRDYRAVQHFAWGFFLMNVVGFATYHIYPAAPPWYYHAHGCFVDMAANPQAGPRLEHVAGELLDQAGLDLAQAELDVVVAHRQDQRAPLGAHEAGERHEDRAEGGVEHDALEPGHGVQGIEVLAVGGVGEEIDDVAVDEEADAQAAIEAALQILPAHKPLERAELLDLTSVTEFHRGRPANGLEFARQAMALWQVHGDLGLMARGHSRIGALLVTMGDAEGGARELLRAASARVSLSGIRWCSP